MKRVIVGLVLALVLALGSTAAVSACCGQYFQVCGWNFSGCPLILSQRVGCEDGRSVLKIRTTLSQAAYVSFYGQRPDGRGELIYPNPNQPNFSYRNRGIAHFTIPWGYREVFMFAVLGSRPAGLDFRSLGNLYAWACNNPCRVQIGRIRITVAPTSCCPVVRKQICPFWWGCQSRDCCENPCLRLRLRVGFCFSCSKDPCNCP